MITVNAHDVARYILEAKGPMSAFKLQKLLYYCQAWSLVWDEKPLFQERIEAWANGPTVPDIYTCHRGQFMISKWEQGNSAKLESPQKDTVNAVLKYYGDQTGQYLSELTHQEAPWKDARIGMAPGQRGNSEITHAAMAEYYGSL